MVTKVVMTSFFGLGRIAEFFEPCILFDYVPGHLTWSKLFLLFDLWPIVVTGALWFITAATTELFFWYIAVAATIDWFVNYGLQVAIGASDNIQPNVCPIVSEQMPAFASEFVVLVWMVFLGLTVILYPNALPGGFIVGTMVMSQIAVYARIYLLFSTPSQLIAGAAVGFAEALLYIFVFALFRHYKIDRRIIAAKRVFLYRFSDTFMFPREPTLIATAPPDKVTYKIYPEEVMLNDVPGTDEPGDASSAIPSRRRRDTQSYTVVIGV